MAAVETRAAVKYIAAIRSSAKKQYAQQYYRWILEGRPEGKNPTYAPLCYMAAQAVRMNLDQIYSGNE